MRITFALILIPSCILLLLCCSCTLEHSSTFREDHAGGEEPLESRIEGTTSPQEEKHVEHDTPELMQVCDSSRLIAVNIEIVQCK